MQTSRIIAITVVVTILVGVLLFGTWVYSGLHDPSAATGSGRTGVLPAVSRVMVRRSIAARAQALPPAPALDSAALLDGASNFQALCTSCHGAPGVPRDISGEGLAPLPRDLSQSDLSERELFWVIRNGLRGRGMPSYRQALTDEQMWAVARFAKSTAGMSEAAYEAIFLRLMQADSTVGGAPTGHMH
jgi:mono/diheme cytochrome c family protein